MAITPFSCKSIKTEVQDCFSASNPRSVLSYVTLILRFRREEIACVDVVPMGAKIVGFNATRLTLNLHDKLAAESFYEIPQNQSSTDPHARKGDKLHIYTKGVSLGLLCSRRSRKLVLKDRQPSLKMMCLVPT